MLFFVFLGGGWTLIPYFCGNEEFCLTPSNRSVDAAIKNVKDNFLLVGILEEYTKFLKLAQILLPTFFNGSLTFYESKYQNLRAISATAFKAGFQECFFFFFF